jgi:diguanylate cyclase (GGDEF)-like protein
VSPSRYRLSLVFGVALTLGFLVLLRTSWLGRPGTVALDDYLCSVVPITSGALCLWRARGESSRAAVGWALLGGAAITWGLGGAVWTVYEVHLGVELPYPSAADGLYLGSIPFAVLGVVLLSGPSGGWMGGLRNLLDGAIVAGALLFISWSTVLGPVFRAGEGSVLARSFSIAYPALDVLVCTIAVLAVAGARGQRRTEMILISSGLATVAISDSSFAWFIAQGSYATGNLLDTGYVAGYLLVGLAALHPTRDVHARPDEPAGTLSLVLPYLPVMVMAGFAMAARAGHRSSEGMLFWSGITVFTLLLARQLLSLGVNQALGRRLQESLTTLRQQEIELRYRADHDDLTGLANRAAFAREATSLLEAVAPRPLGVLVIDVDEFKRVNDTFGHHGGDALLMIVGQRLSALARSGDCVARLGGDEFAVLLHDVPTPDHAHRTAQRFTEALCRPVTLEGTRIPLSASIGVAHSDDSSDLELLLRRADAEMYRSKRSAQNLVPRQASPTTPARQRAQASTRVNSRE